ncbi:MAG: DMT family transporter [Verrucomicrobiales bacterium]|nr:DMT family transporter [Verrucomicrobiales bacterium]
MSEQKNNTAIGGGLLLTVILWGGNNAGTKWLVASWPPIWTGGTRFLLAGFILFAVLRFTNWLGEYQPLTPEHRHSLWLRGGLSLAAYIVAFCWALHLTAASHVALYLGASPIWALLWEEGPRRNWASVRRYGAALLAVTGVLVLFWPALKTANTNLAGEFCGLASSLLWANYNHQSRVLSANIPGVQIAANAMWMSGVWLMPFGLIEVAARGLAVDAPHLGVQSLCILFGGVVPYALWNSALRHWRTSRVMLFNNFIPLTTTVWVYLTLGEPITPTFCAAMALIVAGVAIGQMDWAKIFRMPESF